MMNLKNENRELKRLLEESQALGEDIKKIEAIDMVDARWHIERKIHANHRKALMNRM